MIFTEMGFELYREQLKGYEFMFAFMPYMHTENKSFQKNWQRLRDCSVKMYKFAINC